MLEKAQLGKEDQEIVKRLKSKVHDHSDNI